MCRLSALAARFSPSHSLPTTSRKSPVSRSQLHTSIGLGLIATAVVAWLSAGPVLAQDNSPLQPGEAYVTRFSGTTSTPGASGQPQVQIDVNGTVGSIIDVRGPGRPPTGTQ
jgi:hypothetical protein